MGRAMADVIRASVSHSLKSLSSNLHTNWAWDWRARMWPSEPAMAHWAVNRVEKEAHEAVAR